MRQQGGAAGCGGGLGALPFSRATKGLVRLKKGFVNRRICVDSIEANRTKRLGAGVGSHYEQIDTGAKLGDKAHGGTLKTNQNSLSITRVPTAGGGFSQQHQRVQHYYY